MRTHLHLDGEHERDLPPQFADDDVRFPPALVERFLAVHTDPGDVVFDPFAGFGTTLHVAAAMDRTPHGVEYDRERARYARSRLDDPDRLVRDDVRDVDLSQVPAIDCCLTSPPYVHEGTGRNPLANLGGTDGGYAGYLDALGALFGRIGEHVCPGGRVVIEVANLKAAGEVATLAWDVARAVEGQLAFEGEVVVTWEPDEDGLYGGDGAYGYGYDHSYGLVFAVEDAA